MTPFQTKIMAFALFVPAAFLLYTFAFLMFVIQRRYIIKRYEVETNLAETEKFFEAYRSLFIMFPSTRTILYTTHLYLVILRSDNALRKKYQFKDSPSREVLLSHFSKKERIFTVVTLGCGFLGAAIGFVFLILDWYWSHLLG